MDKLVEKVKAQYNAVVGILIAIIAAMGGYGYYQYDLLTKNIAEKSAEIASLTSALEEEENKNANLSQALLEEQARNDAFASQIENISDTVGDLEKLSQLDPQLLQKYSKVYFLNENYRPAHLMEIPSRYRSPADDDEFIAKEVWSFLKDMIDEAENDGIDLKVASGFRSFEEQSGLKSQYSVTYGSGANAFSADQGYSEHQLGTTVDFTTQALNGGIDSFGNTESYEWLLDNAYKYGFVLSYPPGNAYYVFEPWHWRFVGRKLARDLNNDDQYFYDLDQRKINSYLINLFD